MVVLELENGKKIEIELYPEILKSWWQTDFTTG